MSPIILKCSKTPPRHPIFQTQAALCLPTFAYIPTVYTTKRTIKNVKYKQEITEQTTAARRDAKFKGDRCRRVRIA